LLKAWARDETSWMAWQFDRPETGEGLVQVFRRENSVYESARFPLRGLDANADYAVVDLDAPPEPKEFAGWELMEKGLPVALTEKPTAAVITYKRADAGK
jgi:alpha-galactosidase